MDILGLGRNFVLSWREVRLCSTKIRKPTEANQRTPSAGSCQLTLLMPRQLLPATTPRRNMFLGSSMKYQWLNLFHCFRFLGLKMEETICSKLLMMNRWTFGWSLSIESLRVKSLVMESPKHCHQGLTRKMNQRRDHSSLSRKSKYSSFPLVWWWIFLGNKSDNIPGIGIPSYLFFLSYSWCYNLQLTCRTLIYSLPYNWTIIEWLPNLDGTSLTCLIRTLVTNI